MLPSFARLSLSSCKPCERGGAFSTSIGTPFKENEFQVTQTEYWKWEEERLQWLKDVSTVIEDPKYKAATRTEMDLVKLIQNFRAYRAEYIAERFQQEPNTVSHTDAAGFAEEVADTADSNRLDEMLSAVKKLKLEPSAASGLVEKITAAAESCLAYTTECVRKFLHNSVDYKETTRLGLMLELVDGIPKLTQIADYILGDDAEDAYSSVDDMETTWEEAMSDGSVWWQGYHAYMLNLRFFTHLSHSVAMGKAIVVNIMERDPRYETDTSMKEKEVAKQIATFETYDPKELTEYWRDQRKLDPDGVAAFAYYLVVVAMYKNKVDEMKLDSSTTSLLGEQIKLVAEECRRYTATSVRALLAPIFGSYRLAYMLQFDGDMLKLTPLAEYALSKAPDEHGWEINMNENSEWYKGYLQSDRRTGDGDRPSQRQRV
jgi:hypothetical protein